MSANKAKKVKMATKSCPDCDQQIPVACKSCPCGYVFISRKLLNAKQSERSVPTIESKSDAKRRRTERIRREKINSSSSKDLENRKRSRTNSHSEHIRRGRGRPKTVPGKRLEEEKGRVGDLHRVIVILNQKGYHSLAVISAKGDCFDESKI
ncbi:CP087 protein, partial [Polypterus senegalus]